MAADSDVVYHPYTLDCGRGFKKFFDRDRRLVACGEKGYPGLKPGAPRTHI
jgi:hypothetical protein